MQLVHFVTTDQADIYINPEEVVSILGRQNIVTGHHSRLYMKDGTYYLVDLPSSAVAEQLMMSVTEPKP